MIKNWVITNWSVSIIGDAAIKVGINSYTFYNFGLIYEREAAKMKDLINKKAWNLTNGLTLYCFLGQGKQFGNGVRAVVV